MTEPNQQADSNDARQASMSRVVTAETLLEKVKPEEPASEAADTTASPTPEGETQPKAKKSVQERIVDLIERRKEADAKAEAERKRADELAERLRNIENSRNVPTETPDKPIRSNFDNEEDFIEALTDWKAKKAVIDREREQREAQLQAESEALDEAFTKRLEKTKKEFDDYEEVVGSANVTVPPFMVMAIKESEIGPELVYYLSKHQDEAKRIFSMRPVQALKQLISIERELSTEEEPEVEKPKTKPRAPEPINPLKGAPSTNPAKPKSFADYKAQRTKK